MKLESPESVAQQAVLDLIDQGVTDYVATHGRQPRLREIDKAADEIIEKLTSDRSCYHFSNLRPVLSPDDKTWRLEHVQSKS